MNPTRTSTRRVCWLALVVNVGAVLVTDLAYAQSSEPLLSKANLVYQGAFRVPNLNSPTGATFNYGGTALTYNSTHNSLYMVGHQQFQLSAEISIPALVNSAEVNALNTATLLQPFADPLEGKINSINPTNANPRYIGGQLVYNGNLIVSAYSYYDATGSQTTSHFTRPLNLSSVGQVAGPYRVGTLYPGFVSGYMTPVPPEWQPLFEGPALTGNCCLAITSIQSNGPAVSLFDPAELGVTKPVAATALVGYPYPNALRPGGWSVQSMLFNGTTQITGVVFAQGTRTVLFFGRQGTGAFCYGIGTTNQALNGTLVPAPSVNVRYCYDPASSADHGVHAYPYVYQVWAYDANDLLSVKNGSKSQDQLGPTATWTFKLPFENPTDKHLLGGTGYDVQNGLIYLSQRFEDVNANPIVHVFKVTGSIPTPNPPTQVIAK
jgi:hypothetical protein